MSTRAEPRSSPDVRVFQPFGAKWGIISVRWRTRSESKKRHPLSPLRVYDYFRWQWKHELTAGGKTLVYAIALTGMGTVSVQLPIYQAFCALVVLLATSAGVGSLFRPTVGLEPDLPERGTAGVPLSGPVRVTNRSRFRPAFDLHVGFYDLPDAFEAPPERVAIDQLSPGESAAATVAFTPRSRGIWELPPLRAYSSFPFRVARGGWSKTALPPLLVRPSFTPLDRLDLPAGGGRHAGGNALSNRVGNSPEFLGNREYVPGEPVRRLDVRAWARTGEPVVREFQEEQRPRVAVLLDTRGEPGEAFERAVSRAAAAAEAVVRGSSALAVFGAGDRVLRFAGGRGPSLLGDVLDLLAAVQPRTGGPLDPIPAEFTAALRDVGTVVLVGVDPDPGRVRRVTAADVAVITLGE